MQSARARALGMHAESGLQDLDGRWELALALHVWIQCMYPTPIYITPLSVICRLRAPQPSIFYSPGFLPSACGRQGQLGAQLCDT
jgi:hypothetical protein